MDSIKIKQRLNSKKTSTPIFIGLIIVLVISSFVFCAFASPPTTPYNPGDTLDPACAPGDTNCTVYSPVTLINGNVGIGTASPVNAKLVTSGSVGATLALFGQDTQGLSLIGPEPQIGFNTYYNSGYKSIGGGYGGFIGQGPTTGGIYFFTGTNAISSGDEITVTKRMTLTNSGDLGIGTTDPYGRLEAFKDSAGLWNNTTIAALFGDSRAGQDDNAYINGQTLNFSYGYNGVSDGYINYEGYNAGMTQFRNLYIFDGKGGIVAKFDGSTANVGIGTAWGTVPTRRLDIAADVTHNNSGTSSQLSIRGVADATQKLNIGYDTTSNYGFLEAVDENVVWQNLILQPTDGNVGIGTVIPDYTLTVNGTAKSLGFLNDLGWLGNQADAGQRLAMNNGGGFGAGAVYNSAVLTADKVKVFDLTSVNANAKYFVGGAFDGRYMYFAPYHNGSYYSGEVARYDTTGSFDNADSWKIFNTAAVNSNSRGFAGVTFDGRYVYFAPLSKSSTYDNGQVTRYDITKPFDEGGSYEFFDSTTVNANSYGFEGAVFDGKYVYFSPRQHEAVLHGQVTRYNTTGAFASTSSWEVYNTEAQNANSKGMYGAVFDGRYIYFYPMAANGGQISRYDTTGSFTSSGSWTFFAVSGVDANIVNFSSGTYDGRYIYYQSGKYTVRFDTLGSFSSNSAWSVFDVSTAIGGYLGGRGISFDGRYVYFAPWGDLSNGVTPRYDSSKSFTDTSAWSSFDIATVDSGAKGFQGMLFDGHYVYLIPSYNGVPHGKFVRIEAWPGGLNTPASIAQIARSKDFFMDSMGRIGIGTTTPNYTLSVVGTVQFPAIVNDGTGYYVCLNTSTGQMATSTTACGASSLRFKENIFPLSYGLLEVMQLNPVFFDWKENYISNGGRQIGLIAEDVKDVIPELIGYNNEGEISGLDYPKLTAVLIKAMQELNEKISNQASVISNQASVVSSQIAGGFDGLLDWLSDKVVRAKEFVADKIIVKQLCLEDVCLTRDQLKELLEKNGMVPTPEYTPILTPELEPTSEPTPESTPTPEPTLDPMPTPSPEITPTLN